MTSVPPVTIDPDTRRNLATAARRQRDWTERRNQRIRDAYAAGASLREIADAVGLSHSAVDKIIKKGS